MSSRTQLLIATQNSGKLRELQQLLSDLTFVLIDLSAFPSVQEVPETGDSFLENAQLKSAGYAVQTRLLTLGDDSGLEIDALGGAPGVLSARYLGESASFPARIDALLKQLTTIEPAKRTARFVCAVAIADERGKILNVSVGTCEGSIAQAPRGAGGFGYDPIFIPNEYELTFAEIDPEVKNQISHRAQALKSAHEYLRSLTGALRAD